jgi:type II secretory pathway component PulJ
MTLLEVILATTLLATLLTAVGMILRTGHTAWSAHEQDMTQLEAAAGTVRHISRQVRQASAVVSISSAGGDSGSLSLLMPTGEIFVWDHNSATAEVRFGVGVASDLLAEGITGLQFTAYQADGTTPTAAPAEIRSIVCRADVELGHEAGGSRSFICRSWIRAW